MATLVRLDDKGINLDSMTNWRYFPGEGVLSIWFTGVKEPLCFTGDERARLLVALANNSMEY